MSLKDTILQILGIAIISSLALVLGSLFACWAFNETRFNVPRPTVYIMAALIGFAGGVAMQIVVRMNSP